MMAGYQRDDDAVGAVADRLDVLRTVVAPVEDRGGFAQGHELSCMARSNSAALAPNSWMLACMGAGVWFFAAMRSSAVPRYLVPRLACSCFIRLFQIKAWTFSDNEHRHSIAERPSWHP